MATRRRRVYTASDAFLEAIWDAGITHVFANFGSDHPSLLEAIVHGQKERKGRFPRIITCPNEMVALSMADGFARITNKPQCVVVHVDVGTQGLGAAVHNASRGRVPVLIFAGLSPCTQEGEYAGSRTEYIHWLQDVPEQQQIVAQYCRYTSEIKRGRNIKQIVYRALQLATTAPAGPVYLYGTRESMEEEIEPYSLDPLLWSAVTPSGLPDHAVPEICNLLSQATSPLLICGYTGRNRNCAAVTAALADVLPNLAILDTGGSDVCFPADHPGYLGVRFGVHQRIAEADVILVVDCDVPWIPTQCRPRGDVKVVHIDQDPLKRQIPLFYLPAGARYQADAEMAITQLCEYTTNKIRPKDIQAERTPSVLETPREKAWRDRQDLLDKQAALTESSLQLNSAPINASTLAAQIRRSVPPDTVFVVEAVTLTSLMADYIRPIAPKTWIGCGGGGLGWSGGAALGVKLATDFASDSTSIGGETTSIGGQNAPGRGRVVCQIVGDGSFLFTVPSSVYWISQRYEIPILTIVLNNKGWNAPRQSLLLVHPNGSGSKVDNRELNISLDPSPDYAGIAVAAGGGTIWGARVSTLSELLEKLPLAIQAVEGGVSAVLDVCLDVANPT